MEELMGSAPIKWENGVVTISSFTHEPKQKEQSGCELQQGQCLRSLQKNHLLSCSMR